MLHYAVYGDAITMMRRKASEVPASDEIAFEHAPAQQPPAPDDAGEAAPACRCPRCACMLRVMITVPEEQCKLGVPRSAGGLNVGRPYSERRRRLALALLALVVAAVGAVTVVHELEWQVRAHVTCVSVSVWCRK